MASAFACWTSEAICSASRASPMTGSAPEARRSPARSSIRVNAVTVWPRSTSRRTSGLPIAPVAPATKTFIRTPYRLAIDGIFGDFALEMPAMFAERWAILDAMDEEAIVKYISDTFKGLDILRPEDGPGAGD